MDRHRKGVSDLTPFFVPGFFLVGANLSSLRGLSYTFGRASRRRRRPVAPAQTKSQRVARLTNEDEVGTPGTAAPLSIAHSSLPTWRLVLFLALPALAQQCLLLTVTLSDRFLAGHVRVVSPEEERRALSLHFFSLSGFAPDASGAGPLPHFLSGELTSELSRQMMARQAAVQAAQTTANYLAWFITSYTVLVSVGSTALVARFIGAGDRDKAVRVTHQSLLLAVAFGGLASGIALCGGLEQIVAVLQLQGETADF